MPSTSRFFSNSLSSPSSSSSPGSSSGTPSAGTTTSGGSPACSSGTPAGTPVGTSAADALPEAVADAVAEPVVDLSSLLSGPNPWTLSAQAQASDPAGMPVPRGDRKELPVDQGAVDRLFQELCAADAVLVGAGSGLSFAAGYDYGGPVFARYFADFIARYGFSDMYRGGYHRFASPEEHWAYWSRYILLACYLAPPKPTCTKLLRLLSGRDAFVFTTNVDHCLALAGFPADRFFAIQGDFGLWQCARACHPQTYDNEAHIRRMVAEQHQMRIPSSLVPSCPVCGAPMCMNLRGGHPFVEDEAWEEACTRYQEFLEHVEGRRVLYLLLGIGDNTPTIIRTPLSRMARANPRSFLASVSLEDRAHALAGTAVESDASLAGRSLHLQADIDLVLDLLLQRLQNQN